MGYRCYAYVPHQILIQTLFGRLYLVAPNALRVAVQDDALPLSEPIIDGNRRTESSFQQKCLSLTQHRRRPGSRSAHAIRNDALRLSTAIVGYCELQLLFDWTCEC
jgi:hypothetical protein